MAAKPLTVNVHNNTVKTFSLKLSKVDDAILKQIPDYPSYVASDDGMIFNINRPLKPLSSWVDNTGYRSVVLYRNKRRRYERIHRLVALSFIDNPQNDKQVNHIDGNKQNNHVLNLEWASNSVNTQHAYTTGLYSSTYRCPVRAIPIDGSPVMEFSSIRAMCDTLGINRKTVTSILKGEKLTNNYPYQFEYIYH